MCCWVVRRRNCWRYGISAGAAKEPGGARPPGSLGGNAQRGLRTATWPTPLLARVRVALARSPNFNATESSLQTQKHSRMAAQRERLTSSGESVGCICDRGGRFILRRRRQLAACCAHCKSATRHGCNLSCRRAAVRPFECLGARPGTYFLRNRRYATAAAGALEHDLRANASRLLRRKTGSHPA